MNRHGLTAEAAAQFRDGINMVLSRWAALRMAIENEWGGRDSVQKSQQLEDHLFNLLTQSKEKVYVDDLEDVLDEFMFSLNTEIGDGSIEEVSLKLMEMHEECLEGNFDSIKRLREARTPAVSYVRQPTNDNEEDTDDEEEEEECNNAVNNSSEMDVDPPQCQSNVSQKATSSSEASMKEAPEVVDGWTVVSSRRSRGRKN